MIDLEKIKARRAAIGKADWSVGERVWPKLAATLYLGDDHRVAIYGDRQEANVHFIDHAPADIDALVAEVEQLNAVNDLMAKMLIARGCAEPIADLARCGNQIRELEAEVERLRTERDRWHNAATVLSVEFAKADDLQPCGHPRSAVVTARDLGGPGTCYCGMCVEEK